MNQKIQKMLTGLLQIQHENKGNVAEYCFFFLKYLLCDIIYIELFTRNIRILNNLIVLTEMFPTPDLLDWRIPYIYIYIYIYMCVCVCVCILAHIRTHTHTYTHTHTHTHTYIYIYICMNVCVWMTVRVFVFTGRKIRILSQNAWQCWMITSLKFRSFGTKEFPFRIRFSYRLVITTKKKLYNDSFKKKKTDCRPDFKKKSE